MLTNRMRADVKRFMELMFPDGIQLRCGSCGRASAATPDDCVAFVAHGWPRCCGETVLLDGMPQTREVQ